MLDTLRHAFGWRKYVRLRGLDREKENMQEQTGHERDFVIFALMNVRHSVVHRPTLHSWWKTGVAFPAQRVGDYVKHICREHNQEADHITNLGAKRVFESHSGNRIITDVENDTTRIL